mgnify:FL=1
MFTLSGGGRGVLFLFGRGEGNGYFIGEREGACLNY